MSLVLYELAAADPEVRFSPYCWKTRMALAHKGLEPERRPWRFTEKDAIAFSGQGRVPVLVDDETVVFDSWNIALHLERHYPDRPSLFGGESGMSATRFHNAWADRVLLPALARIVVPDVYDCLDAGDRDYFRTTREERFGLSFAQLRDQQDSALFKYRAVLPPLRAVIEDGGFLSGAAPGYADYCVFGLFMWARCVSPVELFAADDPIAGWREALLDAHDGMARQAPRSVAA